MHSMTGRASGQFGIAWQLRRRQITPPNPPLPQNIKPILDGDLFIECGNKVLEYTVFT